MLKLGGGAKREVEQAPHSADDPPKRVRSTGSLNLGVLGTAAADHAAACDERS